jgi:transcriptional regulator GlxA family with amidase domain
MVVCSEEPKRSADRFPSVRDALPVSLAQALDWLDARPDEPVKLDALAAVAGVRPRTLQAHFRLYLGTTPLSWVRHRS